MILVNPEKEDVRLLNRIYDKSRMETNWHFINLAK